MIDSSNAPMLWKWRFWAGVALVAMLTFYIKLYIDDAGNQALIKAQTLYTHDYPGRL